MDALNLFVEKKQDFLNYLKSRFSLFHESNVFFRDLHYGVMAFLQMNRLPVQYSSSEDLTKRVIAAFEEAKLLLRIDERTWMLNYAAFRKAPAKQAVPAKPAPKQAPPSNPGASKPAQESVAAAAAQVIKEVNH